MIYGNLHFPFVILMTTMNTVPALRAILDDLVLATRDTTPKADVVDAPTADEFGFSAEQFEPVNELTDTEEDAIALAEMLEKRRGTNTMQDFLMGVYAKMFFGTVFCFKYAAEMLASRQNFRWLYMDELKTLCQRGMIRQGMVLVYESGGTAEGRKQERWHAPVHAHFRVPKSSARDPHVSMNARHVTKRDLSMCFNCYKHFVDYTTSGSSESGLVLRNEGLMWN